MSESLNSAVDYQVRIKRSSSWSEFCCNSSKELSTKSYFVSLRSLQECHIKQPKELSCCANSIFPEPKNSVSKNVNCEECCNGIYPKSHTKLSEIPTCEYTNITPCGPTVVSDASISSNFLSKRPLKSEVVESSEKVLDLDKFYQSDSDETADIFGDSESDESDVVPGVRRRRIRFSGQESSDEISEYMGDMLDSDSEQDSSSYSSKPKNSHQTHVDASLMINEQSECESKEEGNSYPNVVEGDGEELEEQSTKANDLDADQDKNNPAYVPRVGRFYMHDHRQTEETDEQSIAVKKKDVNRRWSHDKFRYYDQAPKSTREIVWKYGYDIRREDDDHWRTSGNCDDKIICENTLQQSTGKTFKDKGHDKRLKSTNTSSPAFDYSQKKPIVEEHVHPSRNSGRFTIGRNRFVHKSAYGIVRSTVSTNHPKERSLGLRSCRPYKHVFEQSFSTNRPVCDDVNQKVYNSVRQRRGSSGAYYYGRQSYKNHGPPTDIVRTHQYSTDYNVDDKRSSRHQQNKATTLDSHQKQPTGLQHLPTIQKSVTDSNTGSQKDNIPPMGPKRYSALRQNTSAHDSSHRKIMPSDPLKSKENLLCKPTDVNNNPMLESVSYSRLQPKNTPNQTLSEDSIQNTCVANFGNASSQNPHESLITTSSVSIQGTATFTSLQQSVVYNSSVPLNYTSVNPHITTVYLPNQMHRNIHYQTPTLLPNYVLSNVHQQPHIQDYFPSGIPNTNYVMSPSTTLCFNSSPDSTAAHQPYIVPLEVNSIQPHWDSDQRPVMGKRPRKPLAVIDPRDPSGKECDLLSTEFTRMSCKEKSNEGISSSLSQPLSDQTNC